MTRSSCGAPMSGTAICASLRRMPLTGAEGTLASAGQADRRLSGRATGEVTAGGPLAGCVAIVTGASSGIGRDTCVLLARAGAIPVLVGRDATRLRDTAAAVVEAGGAAPLELPLDVRVEGDMAHMAAATVERHGRIDVLVHAAGILRASGATLRTVGAARGPRVGRGRGTEPARHLSRQPGRAAGDASGRARRDPERVVEVGASGDRLRRAVLRLEIWCHRLGEALAEEVTGSGVVQVMAPGRFATDVLRQTGPLPTPGGVRARGSPTSFSGC